VQLTVPAVPSCIVVIYHSSILLVIATCTGPLTGDRTDEVVMPRGPGRAMFPSPPRTERSRSHSRSHSHSHLCTGVHGWRVADAVPVSVRRASCAVRGTIVLYHSSILLIIAACTGPLTGDHTDDVVVPRGPGQVMFPSPPRPGRQWLGAGPIGSPLHSLVRA
jgi:hypothetical protein